MSDAQVEIETRPDWDLLGPQLVRLVLWFIQQNKDDEYITTHYNYWRALTMVTKCGSVHESPLPELSKNPPRPVALDMAPMAYGDIIHEMIERMYP